MSTSKMLVLFDRICDDRGKVLDLSKEYVADKLKIYHVAEDCVLKKDNMNIEFDRLEEFDELREKVKHIEEAKCLCQDFFEIDEDINKIEYYLKNGELIPLRNLENQSEIIVEEASRLMAESHNYIFVACSDKTYLDNRFEVFRLKHLLVSTKGRFKTEDELSRITNELNKIKFFLKEKMAVSVEEIKRDYEKLEDIYNLLDRIDLDFYNKADFPNRKLYRALYADSENYDKRSNVLYRTIMQDIPRLFLTIRQNCARVCLDRAKRLEIEKNALIHKRDTQIFQIETAFINKRKFNKFEFSVNDRYKVDVIDTEISSKGSKNKVVKDLRDKYNVVLKALESDINTIIATDKRKIESTMEIIQDTENYIKNNIKCFKFRNR